MTSNISTRISKPSDDLLSAPGRNFNSPQKVEDYLAENFHMTKSQSINDRKMKSYQGKIKFRLNKDSSIQNIEDHLFQYGFIKDKNAFEYALKNSKDSKVGRSDAIKIGNNTIDKFAYYEISEDMSSWEIADQLLNHPNYFAVDDVNKVFSF